MENGNKIWFKSLVLLTAVLSWAGIETQLKPNLVNAARRNSAQRIIRRHTKGNQVLQKRLSLTVKSHKRPIPNRKSHLQRKNQLKVPVVTQHGSALVNPSYLNRVKERDNYSLVNNSRNKTYPNLKISDYSNNYHHDSTTINSNRNRSVFKTDFFLPVSTHNDYLYSPQSINVIPNGKAAYIAYNATNSNSSNPKVKHLPFGSVQIIKVGLNHLIKVNMDQDGKIIGKNSYLQNGEYVSAAKKSTDNHSKNNSNDQNKQPSDTQDTNQDGVIDQNDNQNVVQNNDQDTNQIDFNSDKQVQHSGYYARLLKAGPIFKGGHGQAFAYNPRTNTLWLMNNGYGASDHPGIERISLRNLRPINRIKFHLDTLLGDNLAFDGRGRAINVDEAESKHTITKLYALKLFQGRITPKRVHLKLIQGIRKAPNYIIQGLAYNPHNRRIYIVGDESILSVPASRIGRLRPRDVHQMQFKGAREFEGLSFDRYGYGYLLSNRSPEVFKSLYTDF